MPTDRTADLFAIADARCKLRGRAPVTRPRPSKTAFGQSALRLGRALHATESRTIRLAKLACKSSLFDDPAAEIGEISAAVRQELALTASGLEALGRSARPGRQQFAGHSDAVVAWLQVRQKAVIEAFQAALKQREATISAKESRAARLSGVSGVASPFATPTTPAARTGGAASVAPGSGACAGSSAGVRMAKPQLLPTVGGMRRRPVAGGGGGTPFGQLESASAPTTPITARHAAHAPTAGGGHGAHAGRAYHEMDGFGSPAAGYDPGIGESGATGWSSSDVDTPEQLQQFWTPRSQKHRAQEVSAMQSTLAELGSMFQRFGAIVSEQVERPAP